VKELATTQILNVHWIIVGADDHTKSTSSGFTDVGVQMGVNARRIRGAWRMGLTWSVAWALIGGVISFVWVAAWPENMPLRIMLRLFLSGMGQFAVGGFLTGAAFSGILSALAVRGTLPRVSLARFTLPGSLIQSGRIGMLSARSRQASSLPAQLLKTTRASSHRIICATPAGRLPDRSHNKALKARS
jgi:hypothetical protein